MYPRIVNSIKKITTSKYIKQISKESQAKIMGTLTNNDQVDELWMDVLYYCSFSIPHCCGIIGLLQAEFS